MTEMWLLSNCLKMLQDTYRRYIWKCRRDSETKPKSRHECQSVAASRGHEAPLCLPVSHLNLNSRNNFWSAKQKYMQIFTGENSWDHTSIEKLQVTWVDSGMIKSDFWWQSDASDKLIWEKELENYSKAIWVPCKSKTVLLNSGGKKLSSNTIIKSKEHKPHSNKKP